MERWRLSQTKGSSLLHSLLPARVLQWPWRMCGNYQQSHVHLWCRVLRAPVSVCGPVWAFGGPWVGYHGLHPPLGKLQLPVQVCFQLFWGKRATWDCRNTVWSIWKLVISRANLPRDKQKFLKDQRRWLQPPLHSCSRHGHRILGAGISHLAGKAVKKRQEISRKDGWSILIHPLWKESHEVLKTKHWKITSSPPVKILHAGISHIRDAVFAQRIWKDFFMTNSSS